MKIAAVISEYNPFHSGHKYLIDQARLMLGEDTAIIAIMSGNFTQRGELAIADKTVRARAAVEAGVDLVLEIPFPFSMTSAEFYAKSGVHIADSIGVVDYLFFGSECGDTEKLKRVAENTLSDSFTKRVSDELKNSSTNEGYPALLERVYREQFGEAEHIFSSPNDTLAIEYIKAILRKGSKITPLSTKRIGAGYNEDVNLQKEHQSASAIRKLLEANDASALNYIPEMSIPVFEEAYKSGLMPSCQEKMDVAVISSFRLNSPKEKCDIHDAEGGLYNRLIDASRKANGIKALKELASTKKYTSARVMRAIWYSYFGVTSSEVSALPAYTQVLAMNSVGRKVLRSIAKISKFPVITKPSSFYDYSDKVICQKERANTADSVYYLTLNGSIKGTFALTFTPFVKE